MDTTINKIKETINSVISVLFFILLPPNTVVFSISITQIYGETMEGEINVHIKKSPYK
jgi:hypothetical protein